MQGTLFTSEPVGSGMTYGKRLEKALNTAGKQRKELAGRLGCTPQAIGMVITGGGKTERSLSVENHAKAARFLRVDSYWLATGEGSMEIGVTDQQRMLASLSDDAVEIATYFDMLKNPGDRTRAYVAAMADILKVLTEREAANAAQASEKLKRSENPEKRRV